MLVTCSFFVFGDCSANHIYAFTITAIASKPNTLTESALRRQITAIDKAIPLLSNLEKLFDPRLSNGIEILGAAIAEWTSVLVGAIISFTFTANMYWTRCNGGDHSFSDMAIRSAYAFGLTYVTECILIVAEENVTGMSFLEVINRFQQIQLESRLYMILGLMAAGALGIILPVEAGMFSKNACVLSERIQYHT
jgi:hypothetical protein